MNEFEQWIRKFGQLNYGNEFAFTVDNHKESQMKDAYKAGMLAAAEIISRECSGDESGCCCNETTETIKAKAEKL